MNKIRQFLTPGWVLTAVLAIAFSYIAFTVLAPWQLGKNTKTKARNSQIEHAFEVDPVDVDKLMAPDASLNDGDEWRRITAQGSFLPDKEVLLRNRPVGGSPAIHVLTVFQANNGAHYLVNRGVVRPSGTSVPQYDKAPSGKVTISGYARQNELKPETAPIPRSSTDLGQVYGINTEQVSELISDKLNPDYIQLEENSPAVLEAVPLPQLDSGPYLSYGIQWIFFGIMAPGAVVWFIVAELRERRRDREEQEELENAANASATATIAEEENPTDQLVSPDASRETRMGENDHSTNSAAIAQNDRLHDGSRNTSQSVSADPDQQRRERMVRRYGDSGHRFGGARRDNRFDERF